MEFLQVIIKDRGRGFYLSPGMLIGLAIWMGLVHGSHGMGRYGYFSQANNSQVLLRGTVWDVIRNNEQTEFSFRTCSEGELLYQSGSGGDYLKLELVNSTLEFRWRVGAQSDYVHVAGSFNKNTWFNVNVHRFLGNLYLNVSNSGRVIFSEIISNSTFRTYVSSIDLTGSQGLFVGREYTGCFMEGVNVIFSNNMNVQSDNVIWSNQSCTQSDNTCANIANGDINDCYSQPCVKGTCVDGQNNYTCICPHLYNGTNCENDLSQYGCLVDTCLNGGTCLDATDGTRNYRCQCVNGYVGINCESDLDECSSNPCQHSTSCIDKVGAYECNCTGSGFTGTNCDQDINECGTAGVCGTNGNCFNNVGSYTCQCSEGFFGPICQDIDECLSNPCQNNGTCQNQLNTFSCSCVVGFTGNQCQTNIDDCEAINCPGTYSECNDLVNGYECVCEAGYEGTPDSCEEIDECRSSPCKNGARCTNLVNDYSCQCVAGYTDKNCQTNINECEGDPCLNGATCIDGVDTYTCRCLPGFDGTNCDNNIDECGLYQDPCFNGGICNDLINDFNCTCATGFMGYRCMININECESNPCGINSIQCIEGAGTFTCECKPGYTGSTCEINIDECESNPCRNGGTCSDGVNSYTCVCTQNWMGVNCELGYDACSPEFGKCKNQATCMSIPPSQEFNCTCLPGFTGDQCQINIDDCVQNSCVPPKVCYDEVNNSSCRCPLGYEGSDCMTDIDECQSNPCQNNARCEQFLGSYTCDCGSRMAFVPETNGNRSFLTGYQGVNCEQDINECDIVPSICLNRGICQNEAGSFQCLCGRDTFGTYFTGSHCEISTSYCYIADDVKNDQPACKNNGTCNGIIGNYTCGCVPGFTGRRCEINIDECESSPCQYNGTCIDGINSYTCDCIPGITGTNCETNIQECNSNPCLNHGECIDGINRYDCNCTDTGFKGVNCEINIDDCESNPCIHGSTCDDKIKDYSCRCFPGYTDKNCETDINECDSSPCFFNSSCHQKSNQTLYDIDYPGFENLTFSYAEAAGYLCECVNGSTGSNCEININDCKNDSCSFQGKCIDLLNDFRCECFPGYEGDVCETEIDECDRFKPCMHRSTCVDKVADYTCNCADEFNGKIYAGKNCSFELTSCANNRCDQGECEPYLINEARGEQDYRCLCHHGYTGRYCNISTTMSFVKASYLEANLNSLTTEVGFRFRTTLKSAILLAWLNQQMTSFFASVELVNGNICIFFESYSNEYCLPNLRFNNADWHTVSLQFSSNQMRYTITSPLLCSTQPDCIVTAAVDIASSSPSSKVHFGSIQGTNIVPPESFFGTQFVGCMEDITVGGSRLTLTTPNALHSYISLMPGCLREEQCFTATCSQHGACVDLWNKFSCDCYRPYLGDICNTEYTAATFAFNNSKSYATFSLPANMSSKLRTSFDLSFFMRSRQPDGLIMFFGSTTQGYVTAGLESGHLVIQTNLCNVGRKVISENDSYSDGQRHLIRLHRNITNFEFFIGDILQYRTTDIASDCFFNVSEIHFGGKNPFSSSRRKRDAIIVNDVGNFNDVIDYKGTIQDVQLNARSLQFFALPDPDLNPLPSVSVATQVGLQESEVTDPLCHMLSPCDNNSTCSDVFFNDYKCDCLRGYRGKNCSDLDFCVTGQCPDGSTCQSLLDGFECQSNATFNGVDSVAIYNHNIPSTKQIMRFSFKFRTLSMNGKMLHIGTSNRYYRAELIGANLIVGCKLDGAEETLLEANIGVNNSLWHMAEVVEESTQVVLTLKDNHNATLSNVSMARPMNGDTLTSILHDTSSTIVVGINELFDQRRPFYQGCFGEIRIGGILLPFYQDDEFVNNTSIERFFLQTTSGNFDHGCQAGAGCQYSQCRSGSQCVDDYYSYTCSCTQGTTGRWCQEMVDYCTQGDECGNQGHCYSGRNGSLCDCPSGLIGDRCQTDVDECGTLSGACRNGGTCQNENGTFTCNCPTDTLGDLCEANVSETCQQNPCVHGLCNAINVTDSTNTLVEPFNCTCEPGYQGYTCGVAVDNCAAVPCKNGATCTSVVGVGTFNCACPTGYSGPTCADNIDDCSVDICKNGGICVDGLNTYACNCTPSLYYQGPTCTIDIDECEEQQPCQNGGLCVNVNGMGFQCDCRNTGYEGTYCKTDIDECTVQNPCGNGATCTNTDGDYMCNCTEGYEGKNCTAPNCENINCTIGDCMITVQQTWMCSCPEYYDGKYCDIPGLCTLEPCNATNTIRCSQNSTFSYECLCKTGWKGENCSADEDECENVTVCQNGATCVNLPGLFRCDCATGYTGSHCQTDINECASQPCRNGGLCADLIGEFDCNCNGTGYSNETCQIDVDECLDTPCTNGGACRNSDGNYSCTCSNGYGGRNCEVKASPVMEEQDITWFIVGPAVAVVLILIIIGIVCFVNCVRKKRATRGAYSPSRQEVTGSRVELGSVMKKPPLERLI